MTSCKFRNIFSSWLVGQLLNEIPNQVTVGAADVDSKPDCNHRFSFLGFPVPYATIGGISIRRFKG